MYPRCERRVYKAMLDVVCFYMEVQKVDSVINHWLQIAESHKAIISVDVNTT